MRFPLLTWLTAPRRRSHLRRVMRGYLRLKAEGNQNRIDKIKDDLTNIELGGVDGRTAALIFGAASPYAELATRQYLLVRMGDFPLYGALLAALGLPGRPVVHPLPPAWWRRIEGEGLRIAKVRSSILWIAHLLALWTFGIWAGIRHLFSSQAPGQPVSRAHAHFEGITSGNLPSTESGSSHDLVSWYVRRIESATQHVVSHNVRSETRALPGARVEYRPTLPVLSDRAGYCHWLVRAILTSGLDLLRGRWWSAFMLMEATKAAAIRFADPMSIAERYLFSNSVHLYRPLWTYEAEGRGAEIALYFYSTNCEGFKRSWGYPVQTSSWQVANWPVALVWDRWQVDFVGRAAPLVERTEIVGPVDFVDKPVDLARPPGPAIAVFDVQPIRSSLYQSFAPAYEVYVPDNCVAFVRDIESIAVDQGLSLLWKRKRDIGKLLHPRYRKLLDEMSGKAHVIPVTPEIAAWRVVEAADLVVSMPFTSTALIGRYQGKPSCYYDPLALLQPDDRAAHGIVIIQSREELADWIASNSPSSRRAATSATSTL